MRKIKLTQGKYALVDDNDYDRLIKRKWFAHKTKGGLWYVESWKRKGDRDKTLVLYMHRTVMRYFGRKFVIDHINNNGLDNRKLNLRKVTVRQNLLNRFGWKNSTSRYRGVGWYPTRKLWMSRISINGKLKTLGYFKKEKEAAMAYKKVALKFNKEFTSLRKN